MDQHTGPWSLKAHDLIQQADSRLTPRARQAWRWRILYLRAQVDAQLYVSRGVLQGRVLHDALEELTRIYHAQNAEPAVKPPQVDPTEPPVTAGPLDFRGPELADAYERAVLSSTPMAYWRMGEVAGQVQKDTSGNAHSVGCEAGVEFFPPVGPLPANPAAVCWGGRISAAIDHLPDTYSVELWVRSELPPTARAITAYFFSRGVDGPQGTAGGDNLGIGGTHHPENQGKLFFFNGTKCGQVLSGRTALPPGSWHHVVLVRQLQRISVYLDGGRDPEICGQAEIGYPARLRTTVLRWPQRRLCSPRRETGRSERLQPRAECRRRLPHTMRRRSHNRRRLFKTTPRRSPRGTTATCPSGPGVAEDEQRAVSQESIEYLRALRKNAPFGTNGFDLAALRAGMGSRREPSMKGVKFLPVKIGDIPCEWVLAPDADPDLRLLYLHGGGFVSGSGGFYLTLAAHLSAAAKCAVLLPDYRLAPEHRFPAGLEDCIRAHQWLIANGPAGPAPSKATFIAGDSAGGNLTLATLLALRDRGRPLPAGGIALSPTTDLTLSSESLRTVNDPIISASTMPVFRDHYLGKTDPRNPLASPVFGDYRGLPPLLIQVGEHEMLRDDSVRVAEKARADGIPVKLEVWPGMFHVFQSHEPLLPEGREAIDHAADFMRSSLPRR